MNRRHFIRGAVATGALGALRAPAVDFAEALSRPEAGMRLEELVLSRPEAEAYYVQSMSLYADLSLTFSSSSALTERALRRRVDSGPVESRDATPSFQSATPRRWWTTKRLVIGIAANRCPIFQWRTSRRIAAARIFVAPCVISHGG